MNIEGHCGDDDDDDDADDQRDVVMSPEPVVDANGTSEKHN